jgi:hypothetical protein
VNDEAGLDSDVTANLANQGYSLSSTDDSAGHRGSSRRGYVEELADSLPITVELPTIPNVPELLDMTAAVTWDDLDNLDALLDDEGVFHKLVVGSAVGLTTGLTVGYVFWTVRAGYLLTGLIAQMPAWRVVDPLPILNSLDAEVSMDGESLQSIVESGDDGLLATTSTEAGAAS